MGILESIRRWIDGEAPDDPLAEVDEQARPRRIWEEFLVKVAREVEGVMQREMFTPPGGATFIPPEYIVYLSNDDDKEWQGEKRRGLEQGLYYVLSERARELSGTTQLATKSFAVELRVDGTLNKGEFRVQPVWESAEAGGGTMVSPRPQELKVPAPAPSGGRDTAPLSDGEPTEGEVTRVSVRPTELYSVEIWKDGVRQTVVPVTKHEVTVGRGSKSVSVDLPIKGDPEVSRLHATLEYDNEGRYWFTPKGRNPTFVAGREIPREERVEVKPDQKIEIASYSLRIQPK
ncbi:MAG TPA: FHA domain-containing protein [Pyrinomonadaceae bacterium]|nr:FHA domain-containing protein [Pyrinomonadaceae bacterium]